MRGQFWLEVKKQPWLLHLFWFVVIAAVLGSAMVGWETSRKRGAGMPPHIEQTRWDDGTTAGEISYNQWVLRHESSPMKDGVYVTPTGRRNAKLRQVMLADYQKRDFRHMNRAIAKAIAADPGILRGGITELNQMTNDQVNRADQTAALMHYMVTHNFNWVIQVETTTSVLNNVTGVLGLDNNFGSTSGSSQKVIPLLLVMGMTLFAVVFFQDRRRHTDQLMRVAPLNLGVQALLRGGITLAVLNVSLLLVLGGTILVMILIPGHDFGSWLYPVAHTLGNHTSVMPLWQVLAREWLLLNLWWLVIGAGTFALSLVSRNLLVGLFLMSLVVFAGQLKLLSLVPAAWQLYVPSTHVALNKVILNLVGYRSTAFWQVALVFGAWFLGLGAVGAGLLQLRQRVQWLNRA